MVELMKALGKTTICMDKESIRGQMAGNTMESITWIRNTDMVSIVGLMGGGMKDIGLMENNMEKENTYCLMVLQRLAYGKMENVLSG